MNFLWSLTNVVRRGKVPDPTVFETLDTNTRTCSNLSGTDISVDASESAVRESFERGEVYRKHSRRGSRRVISSPSRRDNIDISNPSSDDGPFTRSEFGEDDLEILASVGPRKHSRTCTPRTGTTEMSHTSTSASHEAAWQNWKPTRIIDLSECEVSEIGLPPQPPVGNVGPRPLEGTPGYTTLLPLSLTSTLFTINSEDPGHVANGLDSDQKVADNFDECGKEVEEVKTPERGLSFDGPVTTWRDLDEVQGRRRG